MDLAWNAIVLGCLWGACDLMAPGNLSRHVGRLVALGFLSLLGFAICALGFVPTPAPPFIEALPPNKVLAPLFLGVGGIGWLRGMARAVLRARVEGIASLSQTRAWPIGGWRGQVLLASASFASMGLCAVALLPPARVDEALYHLALPAQYLRAGGFSVVPGHGNAGFPALGEMLFMWCMGAGALPAARAVQIVALDMGAHILAHFLPAARKTLPVALGLFLLTPVVLWELPAAYVDVLQAVFEVVSLLLLARWAQDMSIRTMLAAGWLAGCAAACKYLALAHLPFFFLSALLILRKSGRTDRTFGVGLAALCAIVPPLPWLVHNAVMFGNPLFPFASDFFPDGVRLLPAQMQVLDLFMMQHGPLAPDGRPLEGIAALLQLPWAFLTDASFSSPSFDGVMGWIPAWCLLLGIAAKVLMRAPRVPVVKNDWESKQATEAEVTARVTIAYPPSNCDEHSISPVLVRLLVAYVVFRFAIWLSTSWQMRFLIGPALAMCILCALFCYALPRRPRRVALVLMFASSCATLWNHRAFAQRFDWHAVIFSDARHNLRLDYDPASALCDRALGAHVQRLMLVWTQRRALYCDVPLYTDSYDEGASLAQWLADGAPSALRELQSHGISHVLIDETAFHAASPERAAAYAALRSHAFTRVDAWGDIFLFTVAPAVNRVEPERGDVLR